MGISHNKIVVINQSCGYLTIDIANALIDKYSEVVLLYGSLKSMDIPLSDKIKHGRVLPYNRKSKLTRVFTWLVATVQIFVKLLFIYRKHEILYVTNPPMSYFVSLLVRRRYSIVVYDIYPDALKNIGLSEDNLIYRLWNKCNKILFGSANKVFTLSEGMQNSLLQYTSKEKICVIPNWSHLSDIKPVKKENNSFVRDMNLAGKFIVLYSGNIGYTHSLEVVVEAANILSENKEMVFLFIGDGAKKKKLEQMVRDYNLNNCIFLDWQPQSQLINTLSSADLSIVTLNDATAMLSVPSKTYNLMAVGSPLLAIANAHSELSKLIMNYKCGSCFDPTEPSEIAKYILALKDNEKTREELSQNARLASSFFTKQNAFIYADNL